MLRKRNLIAGAITGGVLGVAVNGMLVLAVDRYQVEHPGDPPEACVIVTIVRILYAPLESILTYFMNNGEPNYRLYFVLVFFYTGILGSVIGTLVVLAMAWLGARTEPAQPKTRP